MVVNITYRTLLKYSAWNGFNFQQLVLTLNNLVYNACLSLSFKLDFTGVLSGYNCKYWPISHLLTKPFQLVKASEICNISFLYWQRPRKSQFLVTLYIISECNYAFCIYCQSMSLEMSLKAIKRWIQLFLNA